MKKALLLDRDGTINVQVTGQYVTNIHDFVLVEGIVDLMLGFREKGYEIIVITNQGCIDKQICTFRDVDELHYLMKKMLLEKHGVKILDVYYCPHHPSVTGVCECRKPSPLMFYRAARDHNIDLSESVAIGDSLIDVIAAKRAGVGQIRKIETNKIN